jgi:hypothetical protein
MSTEEEIKKIVDKSVNDSMSILNVYTQTKMEQVSKNIQMLEKAHEYIKKEIEKYANVISNKEGYSDYIKYIVSSDFKEKEKELINKVEQLILDKMAVKKNNNLLYIYVAIAVIFVIQIVSFVIK